MLTDIHFLLTYNCNYECDHCFLYCGPHASGTFTLARLKETFAQIEKIGSIESAYFEGGEPFLYYPPMLEGLRIAKDMGLKTGIVTNSYWAQTEDDAKLWLEPLVSLGISDLSVSDDSFHSEDPEQSPGKKAVAAARELGLPVTSISIDKPAQASGAKLKGRAVEKLAEGLPGQSRDTFKECKDEDLRDPGRVHLDPLGFVHLCQGLVMGNAWDTPLSNLVLQYDPDAHPIVGPLLKGGPALLAETYDVECEAEYASACHMCYLTRLALLDKFPGYLAPGQVYGI